MKIDLYSKINKPLVELILGMPIEESNKEQVEIEMGTKMFLFERQFTKLIDVNGRKCSQPFSFYEMIAYH